MVRRKEEYQDFFTLSVPRGTLIGCTGVFIRGMYLDTWLSLKLGDIQINERGEKIITSLVPVHLQATLKRLLEEKSARAYIPQIGILNLEIIPAVDQYPYAEPWIVKISFRDCDGKLHEKNSDFFEKACQRKRAIKRINLNFGFPNIDENAWHNQKGHFNLQPLLEAVSCLGISVPAEDFYRQVEAAWLNVQPQFFIAEFNSVRLSGGLTAEHLGVHKYNEENARISFLEREGSVIHLGMALPPADFFGAAFPTFEFALDLADGYNLTDHALEKAADLIEASLNFYRFRG